MQLTERHIIHNSKQLEELCAKSKRLYNYTLYHLRQALFGKIEKFTEFELIKLMTEFNQEDFRSLPNNISQSVVKNCFQNWNSYWKALKDYKQNQQKYIGRPKLPKYKEEQFVINFTKNTIRFKNDDVTFVNKIITSLKTQIPKEQIKCVRIIPKANHHIIEVIYEKETANLNLDKSNIVSIDPGINNLLTTVNNAGALPFIINGKNLKAFNQWYNKEKSKLQSQLPQGKHWSKHLSNLTNYRNRYIEDKLHKISRFVIDWCIQNNIGTIVIGKNDGWKDGCNMGNKTNQHFVQLPHAKLIQKIQYKAELVGINVILTEESYTSKIDHLIMEPMRHRTMYNGKRVKRGLFRSKHPRITHINADANGAMGIGRKVFGNDFTRSLTNSSCAFQQYKINIL